MPRDAKGIKEQQESLLRVLYGRRRSFFRAETYASNATPNRFCHSLENLCYDVTVAEKVEHNIFYKSVCMHILDTMGSQLQRFRRTDMGGSGWWFWQGGYAETSVYWKLRILTTIK